MKKSWNESGILIIEICGNILWYHKYSSELLRYFALFSL